MTDSRHLQRLVDDQRIDELLREVTLADIAAACLRYHRRDHPVPPLPPDDDPDWWAIEIWMESRWWADEARVRHGILELIAVAETDDDFGWLGAAIMEVFIDDNEDRLRWIEEQAEQSEAFRRSLRNVWIWGEVLDESAQRVEAAAGVPLARPKGTVDPNPA